MTTTTHTTARRTGPRLKDQDKPSGPPHGNTHSDAEQHESPRLPHEHDESADSQDSQPREVIRQAHRDVSRGLTDTDKGPPMNDAYEKQAKPGRD